MDLTLWGGLRPLLGHTDEMERQFEREKSKRRGQAPTAAPEHGLHVRLWP